jgi:hypothetical protein
MSIWAGNIYGGAVSRNARACLVLEGEGNLPATAMCALVLQTCIPQSSMAFFFLCDHSAAYPSSNPSSKTPVDPATFSPKRPAEISLYMRTQQHRPGANPCARADVSLKGSSLSTAHYWRPATEQGVAATGSQNGGGMSVRRRRYGWRHCGLSKNRMAKFFAAAAVAAATVPSCESGGKEGNGHARNVRIEMEAYVSFLRNPARPFRDPNYSLSEVGWMTIGNDRQICKYRFLFFSFFFFFFFSLSS